MAINGIVIPEKKEDEEKVELDISCGKHTPEGHLIGNMYRGGLLDQILAKDEYACCPHDGMQHTLLLHMTKKGIVSMLVLIDEHYSEQSSVWVERAQAFIVHVEKKLEEVK